MAGILSAYLDIETSFQGMITVVGIHRPQLGTWQWVGREINTHNVLSALGDTELIKTYNGERFDLPVLKKYLGLDLKSFYQHCDLMYLCWQQGLKGGLKAVEKQLGIHRTTSAINGIQAMHLWAQWQEQGDQAALKLLLQYNREDVELLAQVENLLLERIKVYLG